MGWARAEKRAFWGGGGYFQHGEGGHTSVSGGDWDNNRHGSYPVTFVVE